MLIIVVTVLLVLIVALFGIAATKPNTFRVQRATSIQAPPEKIFPFINDFHSWGAWSPWEKIDPAMKRTHSGVASGEGAVYEWDGNNKVGKGRMEIMNAQPPAKVTIKLDFLKPFEGHNIAEFTLVPQGGSTDVTWVMHGPSRFITKVIQVFISMDAMIGKEFEKGLADLKGVAEK
jgi:carbon monoxide dehydrogenase subunit G